MSFRLIFLVFFTTIISTTLLSSDKNNSATNIDCNKDLGFIAKISRAITKAAEVIANVTTNPFKKKTEDTFKYGWESDHESKQKPLLELYNRISHAKNDQKKLEIFEQALKGFKLESHQAIKYLLTLLSSVSDSSLKEFIIKISSMKLYKSNIFYSIERLVDLKMERQFLDKVIDDFMSGRDGSELHIYLSKISSLQKAGYTDEFLLNFILQNIDKSSYYGLAFIDNLNFMNISKKQKLSIIHSIIDSSDGRGIIANIDKLKAIGFDDNEIFELMIRFSNNANSSISFNEVSSLSFLNFSNETEAKAKLKTFLKNLARTKAMSDSYCDILDSLSEVTKLGFEDKDIYELLTVFAKNINFKSKFSSITKLAEFFDLDNTEARSKMLTLLKMMAKSRNMNSIFKNLSQLYAIGLTNYEIYELLFIATTNFKRNYSEDFLLKLGETSLTFKQKKQIITNIAKSKTILFGLSANGLVECFGFNSTQIKEFEHIAFVANPSKYINDRFSWRLDHLPIVATKKGEKSKHQIISDFLEFNENIDPDVLISPVKREYVMKYLLYTYGKNYQHFKDQKIKHASQILALALGLSDDQAIALKNAKTGDILGDFYALGFEYTRLITEPKLGQLLNFDPQLFNKKSISNFNKLLGSIIDLRSIYPDQEDFKKVFAAVIKEFGATIKSDTESIIVDRNNIVDLHSIIAEKITIRFKQVLGEDKDFSYQRIMALKDRWGDIKEIKVLLARFLGETNWNILLKDLGEIFSAVLDRNFHEFRFIGITDARKAQIEAQIGHLSTNQAKLWQEAHTRSKLKFVAGSKADSYKFIKSKLAEVPNSINQLLANTNSEDLKKVKDSIANGLSDILNIDFSLVFKNLATIKKKYSMNEQQVVVMLSERLKSEISNLSLKIKKIDNETNLEQILNSEIPILQGYINEFKQTINLSNSFSDEVKTQLLSDIKTISNKFNEVNSALTKDPIDTLVFTTIVSDARTMSRIGDCVATSSCQNYRTGFQIYTLPGYIKDPNIQAILSFNIRANDFINKDNFYIVSEAQKNDWIVERFYDGESMEVVFNILDPKTQDTSEIRVKKELANYRSLIKIGQFKESKKPGTVLEDAFTQNNILQNKQEVLAITDDLSIDMGIETKVPDDGKVLIIKASTASLGQYSDLAGGAKTDDYEINN